MLLIGSRAIRFHLPGFREPRDWDLVATEEELARVAAALPANQWPHKEGEDPRPTNRGSDLKHLFRYGENLVEVARASLIPYWEKVRTLFADAEVIVDPVLGELRIAPLDFLLLTKQCGLVYPIVHWHKNLADVYTLRDSLRSVSREVADLWPDCMEDSRRMFKETHARREHRLSCCHPSAHPVEDVDLHVTLHRAFSMGLTPVGEALEDTWRVPGEMGPAARKAFLLRRLAQEVQVVAVEQLLWDLAEGGNDIPGADRFLMGATKWLRWALREMAIGPLPVELRYFVVNHYRELRDLVPERWTDPILNTHPRLTPNRP